MHYSDSLKEDNLHKLLESHSKNFQNSHFDFLALFEHDFFEIYEIYIAKGTGANMYSILSCYNYRVYFRSPEVRSDC